MVLTPEKVYEELSNNKLNKSRAYDLLISLVENSENEEIREDSIKYLEKVGVFNDKLYDFLENILISDSNTAVRIKAAKFLRKKFLEKSFKPFKWVIDHEKDCECTIIAIKSLKKIHSSETKLLLFNQ
ncbi:MAG: HEAT repeat domain-containing protein, partial [Promethearchaeota archaeon]